MQLIVVYRRHRRPHSYRASSVMKPMYQYADQTTGTNKDLGILRCDVSLGQMFPTFRRTIVSSSSGWNSTKKTITGKIWNKIIFRINWVQYIIFVPEYWKKSLCVAIQEKAYSPETWVIQPNFKLRINTGTVSTSAILPVFSFSEWNKKKLMNTKRIIFQAP